MIEAIKAKPFRFMMLNGSFNNTTGTNALFIFKLKRENGKL